MKDRRLPHHNAEELRQIAAQGGALNLRQLAVITNYSYDRIRGQAKMPGFPLMDGKVFLDHYHEWIRRRTGLEPAPDDEGCGLP